MILDLNLKKKELIKIIFDYLNKNSYILVTINRF
jgi:hypothetical protein